MAKVLDGVDLYGYPQGGSVINVRLHYRDEDDDEGDWDMGDQVELQSAGFDTAAVDWNKYLKLFLDNLPAIIDMLKKFGVLKDGATTAGLFDGGFGGNLGLLLKYLPQIIDLLIQLGVLKPQGEGAPKVSDEP